MTEGIGIASFTIAVIALTSASGCNPADVVVDGRGFHLSSALVTPTYDPSPDDTDPEYWVWIANVADPCLFDSAPEALRPVDDLWFQLSARWFALDGTPPEFGYATICISEDVPCSQYGDPQYAYYGTTGGEVIRAYEDRLELSLPFTVGGNLSEAEPLLIELDLPIARCE